MAPSPQSTLLPLYVPLLDNSVMTLMLFDEVKSFTFLTTMSLQELCLLPPALTRSKWFWELYSHGRFIYDKINKTTKVLFALCDKLPDPKRCVVFKAICDLCKECQPDAQLIEVGVAACSHVASALAGAAVRHFQ